MSSPRRTVRRDGGAAVIAGLLASIALLALSACSATRVTDVWTDPGYSGGPLHQVAVFVLGTDEAIRDLVENEFARRLPMSTRGVGGHGLVPAAEQGDIEKVRARLQAAGFDGVIIGRLVGVEGPQRWAPGSLQQLPQSYRTLDNYYLTTYQETERSPFQANTVIRVQTNVYAVATKALVWSAAGQMFNPDEARDAAGDLAKVVVERLQKAGILAAE